MSNVKIFSDTILFDIEWRLSEIATVKTLPYRYVISEAHRTFLLLQSIPIIYGLWEGFIKNSFENYTKELNNLQIKITELNMNIITHTIDQKFPQLASEVKDFEKQKKYVSEFIEYINKEEFKISSAIPTESNINLKVLNKILKRYNLPLIENEQYNHSFNKLLRIRNAVVHGEKGVVIQQKDIDELSSFVISMMHELLMLLSEALEKQSYLK